MSWTKTNKLRAEIFGESHGPCVGVRIAGLPAGESVDLRELQRFLDRRAPGRSELSTPRREADRPRVLSGLTGGVTDGGVFEAVIDNANVRPADYEALRFVPRPGHADYPAFVKSGGAALPGGGAFSGRLTAPLCVAGGICLQLLRRRGVVLAAHIAELGGIADEPLDPVNTDAAALERLAEKDFPVLDEARGEAMRAAILAAKAEGDSLGGVVECAAVGLPVGLGGPLFDGLESVLAAALFGIPAVKGVDFGAGFGAARLRGSGNNDPYALRDGRVAALTNRAGGILGGMSTGMPLVFRAAFKPTPSIALPQRSVDLQRMEETELRVSGRHDPCVVPRAVPAVEAAAAVVLLDAMLD